jgi:hypothetical protein
MKRELDDDELEKYIKLFWELAEQQKIRNSLEFYKKKHILKCGLKRDASILKSNPLYFLKNMIRKPITILALIKYKLLQQYKTIRLLENTP